MLDSLVYGLLPDKSMGVISNGVNYSVKAKKIIIASGAKENYMAFPGSTLPGVMGAGAAQTMINVNRVLPESGSSWWAAETMGLIVSYQLMQAGARSSRHCGGCTEDRRIRRSRGGKIRKSRRAGSMLGTPSNRYMERKRSRAWRSQLWMRSGI